MGHGQSSWGLEAWLGWRCELWGWFKARAPAERSWSVDSREEAPGRRPAVLQQPEFSENEGAAREAGKNPRMSGCVRKRGCLGKGHDQSCETPHRSLRKGSKGRLGGSFSWSV